MFSRREITLIFSIGVVCHSVIGFQESIRRETLCSDGEPVVLNCSDDRVISIEKTESGDHKCNLGCDTKFLEDLKVLCNGNFTCNVTSDIFPDECNRFSRYLRTNIDCKYWAGKTGRSFDVCSNKLSRIHCDNFFWYHHIHFISVSDKSELQCDNEPDNGCLLNRLKSLCNEKEYCSDDVDDDSCLFPKQYMHISYLCSEISTQTPSNASTEAITSTLPDISATSTAKIFTETPGSNQGKNMLTLNGNLLLVNYDLQNLSHVLCIDDWNDKAASVACKFLNLPMLGRAINLTNTNNYPVINISLNCSGQEQSLRECGFTETQCSSTMAAGVVCCDAGQNCPNQKPPPSQKSTGNTETSYTGLAVGLALVAVTALVGTLVVLYLRHGGRLKFMCFDELKKPNRYSSDNDYLGQQGISLPESSRGSARNVINNDNNENETLYENQPKHRIDSTENAQFYSLASSPEDQTQYATAKEGEYDVTNSRRHVANDGNLYDHSVDTVYDTTGNQEGNLTSDNTYARTVDNVYDGTARKRTNDRVTDGVYNHPTEATYGVHFSKKNQSNDYDA